MAAARGIRVCRCSSTAALRAVTNSSVVRVLAPNYHLLSKVASVEQAEQIAGMVDYEESLHCVRGKMVDCMIQHEGKWPAW